MCWLTIINAWGLAVQHSAAVICCCFQGTLAKFRFFAAGRVNAMCVGGGREICTSARAFIWLCWGLEKLSTTSFIAPGRMKELTKYSFNLFEAAFISPEGGEWSSWILGGMRVIQDCPFSLTRQTPQRKIKTFRRRLSNLLTCFCKVQRYLAVDWSFVRATE